MKKSLILLSVFVLSLCSCGSKKDTFDPTAITSITERKIPYGSIVAYKDGDEQKYSVSVSSTITRRIYDINNETIPYVSFSDFAKDYAKYTSLIDGTTIQYTVSFENNIVKVVNPTNKAYMEFNTQDRVVTYHGFELFFDLKSSADDRFFGDIYGSKILDDKRITYDYYLGKDTVSFSLADYSIKDYVYLDNVFLPFETLCTLFNQSDTASEVYAGDRFYIYSASANELGNTINDYIRKQGTEWMTPNYLSSCYNNLAFALDMLYGLDKRPSRVEKGKIIEYKPKGAYSVLEPYKERLVSTELNVSNDAMIDLMKNEFDDGGHSNYYSFTNFLSDKNTTRIESCGEESANTLNTITNIQKARKEKGTDGNTLYPGRYCNGYYKEYDNTAYIQFDTFFMNETKTKQDYIDKNIDETNYISDSISLFYYANEKIQNNPNIKNVIIDLSANGGGDIFASEYIASWVCGGNYGAYHNCKTNAFIKYCVKADVNFDGKFDEKDYLSSDKNVYVMISNGSYSCGNKLPCNIKDNRPNNTYFIGSETGGGSCVVNKLPFSYLGGQMKISTNKQMGRLNATQNNFISSESGVEADYLKFDNTDYASFADIDTIISKINNAA